MSEQREVEAGDLLSIPETKAQKKARLAAVLDRGFVNYRLQTDRILPKDTYGQWVRNDANEIANYEALGFEVYKGDGGNKAQDGTHRVGDVILMYTSKEQKELLDEVQRDKYNRVHGLRTSQIEEENFKRNVREDGITPVVESRVEEVDGQTISKALKE